MVYVKPGVVEVRDIEYPKLQGAHSVIIRPLATNICGSDQHMVRGRTDAPEGLILGHEITGEVVEVGSGVEHIKKHDIVSVPFNIGCPFCENVSIYGYCIVSNFQLVSNCDIFLSFRSIL